jgi:hypothetical protein
MLTGTLSVLEGRTGAIRGDTAFDVNRVRVVIGILVRGVNNLDITGSKQSELKRFPRGSFDTLRISIKQFENL